jgi:membrane-bound ClpP family serine protease
MIIFISLAIGAFILVAGSFVFGHDDVGHSDLGHDVDTGAADGTISIFSTKVIGTLLMGFGSAGAIAMYYGASHVTASLIGVASGLGLAGLMYLVLGFFYTQQASSLVSTNSAVGCPGSVTVSIGTDSPGEVGIDLEGQYRTFSASSTDGQPIAKGRTIRVVKTVGSHLVVEPDA